jgi:hypothetical protein
MRAAFGLALAVPFASASPAWSQTRTQETAAPDGRLMPPIVRDCRDERAQGEIVVCGNREERRSPFELPVLNDRFDPNGEMESVSRERHGLYEVGDTGIHSCSTVGPGGYTGCDFIRWKADREQDADKNIYRGERPKKKESGVSIGVGPLRAKPFGE